MWRCAQNEKKMCPRRLIGLLKETRTNKQKQRARKREERRENASLRYVHDRPLTWGRSFLLDIDALNDKDVPRLVDLDVDLFQSSKGDELNVATISAILAHLCNVGFDRLIVHERLEMVCIVRNVFADLSSEVGMVPLAPCVLVSTCTEEAVAVASGVFELEIQSCKLMFEFAHAIKVVVVISVFWVGLVAIVCTVPP